MTDLSMLPDFIAEAMEHLEELESSLLLLEQHQEDKDVLNDIFRSMHTIKGAAQFVGIDRVSELSHKLESLLDLIRRGEQQLKEGHIDLLIEGKDRISLLVGELEQSQVEETEISDLIHRINQSVEADDATATDSGITAAVAEQKESSTGDSYIEISEAKEPLSSLKSDIMEEEHDEELYDIFMQQLQENIPFLHSLAADLSSSVDKQDLLNRCSNGIKILKSSANYMGYEKLTQHYTTWQEAIDGAAAQLSKGLDPDLGFIQSRINAIVSVYPQAMEGVSISKDTDNITDALDAFFSEESPTEGSEGEVVALPVSDDHDDLKAVLDSALDDAFDEPLGGTGQDTAALVNEVLGEEHDEELLEIFMKQLQESIPFLHSQIADLANSDDKQDVLNRCSNGIKSLQSSANYMGYEKLTHHYTTWQDEIDGVAVQLSKGLEPDLAFMQSRINAIVSVYPQAMAGASISKDADNITDVLDAFFSEETSAEINEDGADISSTDDGDRHKELDAALASALSDAFDEPLGGKEQDAQSAVLENEALEEEYDTELLGIFIQQLKESIPFLHAQIADLGTSVDKQEVLNRCSDAVKILNSSANYMGYQKLTHHYTLWQDEIEVAGAKLSDGQEPGLAFMQSRIDEVITAYPQAMEYGQQKKISLPALQTQEAASTAGYDEFEDITDTIDSMLSAPPVTADKVEDTGTDTVGTPAEGIAEVDGQEAVKLPSDSDGEDQELFNKLSFALDASLEQAGNVPLKPMHTVIEEMITSSDEEAAEEEVPVGRSPAAAMEQAEAEAVTGQSDLQKEEERRKEERRQSERRQEERRAMKEVGTKKIKQSMRVDADKIDFMMNQVGELVVSRAYFAQLFAEMKGLQQNLMENSGLTKSQLKPLNEFAFRLGEAGVALGRVSNELQDGVMKVRMLPIDQLFKRYPRLVRDLIHKTDKQITLVTKGEDTELDKMVIEEISDPLIHIIRNAVDHGIETAAERKHLGKPESGTLTLEAYHESDHIVIEVTDDGGGLDVGRVKAKAVAKGLHSSEELERMSQTELIYLVMQPGFSTAEKTTKTSGRGVGMDVVKKNIEKLNGSVEIETKSGKGTRIRIKIPLTMAIIQALMVRVGNEKFTIPLRAVEETLRIFQQDISVIEGIDVIHLRETTMPIFRLSRLFGIQRVAQDDEKLFVVVVKTGMQALGLVVDELLGQEEVVIKPLADYLRQESGFAGATILGDGGISLILDIPELVKMTTDKQVKKQIKLSCGRQAAVNNYIEEQAQVIH